MVGNAWTDTAQKTVFRTHWESQLWYVFVNEHNYIDILRGSKAFNGKDGIFLLFGCLVLSPQIYEK